MRRMNPPKLEIIHFATEDVIATSVGIITGAQYAQILSSLSWGSSGNELGIVSSDYYILNGQMTNFDSDAQGWVFNAPSNYQRISAEEYADIVAGSSPYNTTEVYNLYQTESSSTTWYTKGASYYELNGNSN